LFANTVILKVNPNLLVGIEVGAALGQKENLQLRSMRAHKLANRLRVMKQQECQVAGLFAFMPYLIESGLLEVADRLPRPGSARLGKTQALLSFLVLKLIGGERLCPIHQYDHDVGLGLFAGLKVLPQPTYAGTYSCLLSASLCQTRQQQLMARRRAWAPAAFAGATINLDFHSIPHFGQHSAMEQVWCGTRHKAMKGANTFFAQDLRFLSMGTRKAKSSVPTGG
jgi:hypothetical protein